MSDNDNTPPNRGSNIGDRTYFGINTVALFPAAPKSTARLTRMDDHFPLLWEPVNAERIVSDELNVDLVSQGY